MLLAAIAALGLSLLAEWRMQGIVAGGSPSEPLAWSGVRIALVAFLLLLGLAPLSLWIARGGLGRAGRRLVADRGRTARRLGVAVAVSAGAALAGWLLGWVAAWIQDNPGDWRYSLTLMAFGVALTLLLLFRDEVLADGAWGFLILGLSVGVTFAALVPIQPNSVWDGQGHFNAANAMSYVEDAEYDEGDAIALMDIPYIMEGHDDWRVWSDMGLDVLDLTTGEIDRLQREGEVEVLEGQARHGGASWVSFNAIGRVPLAVGLWLGRIVGFGNVGEYVTARIVNLVTYVLLWFFGIRGLADSKLVLSAVALAPTALYLAAGFSYDAWLLGCLGFAFCRYLGEIQRPYEPLTAGNAALVLVPFGLGCLVKAIYFPLALVFLAMPGGKFSREGSIGRGWWSLWVVLCAVLLCSTFALPFVFRGGAGYTDSRMHEGASSTGQLAHIFEAPGDYATALWASGVEFFGPASFRDGTALIGFVKPSAFEGPLGWIYLAFLGLVALFVRRPREAGGALVLSRIFALIGMLGAYVLFATALYIGFTGVGGSEVDGLQPRYLLPLFPLLFGVVLDVPPLARLAGRRLGTLERASWTFLFLYFLAFTTLHFVVFFE